MRRTICALSIAALVGGASPLGGQTTQPTQTQPKTGTPSDSEMKLTGCLRERDQAGTRGGTTAGGGTGSSTAGASRYLLEVLGPEGGASATGGTGTRGTGRPTTSAPGAPGTSGSSGAMAAKTIYALMAPESVGLSKHVNHQIEVTGKRSGDGHGTTTSGTAPGASASGSTPTKTPPTFEVTAVRMISASCQSSD